MIDSARLLAETFVEHIELHEELASTQDLARELALDRDEFVILVIAARQTAGRGRGSNRWWTGEGSIALSLAVDLGKQASRLSLAVGVALVEALRERAAPHSIGLHWPNDVYVADRKMAGILTEYLSLGRHIIGIGLNLNNSLADVPADLRPRVTTLCELTGRTHDPTDVLIELLHTLERALGDLFAPHDPLGPRFNELCLQHGQMLTVHQGTEKIAGLCAGIAPDGGLLLDTDSGRRVMYSGTLHPM